MDLFKNKGILLFYKKHEWDYNPSCPKRTVSGFYAWYLRLIECLKRQGYQVHLNDFDLARKNPDYPVGIVGTPLILQEWELLNPAILGPSMYDHPKMNPTLMLDKRFKYYILTCKWLKDVFETYYRDCCVLWYAGIETDVWVDTKNNTKSIDLLIYDKIRWNREYIIPLILEPIVSSIKKKDLLTTYCGMEIYHIPDIKSC